MTRSPRTASSTRTAAKPWSRAMQVRRNLLLSPDQEWAEEVVRKVTASCHDAGQLDFALDPARYITALVGRGGGKTTGGVARFIIRMVRTPKARCLYIGLTKEDAKQLIWEKLRDFVDRLQIEARFHESTATVTFVRNGASLRLVGADDNKEINKLRGVPYHEVGIDEAAAMQIRLLESLVHRVIGPRLGDYDGTIWMISTPGHDMSGLFYDATRPGSDIHRPYKDRDRPEYCDASDPGYKEWRWSSHHWNLRDAVAVVPAIHNLWARALADKARNKWSDNHPVWRREYLGEWAADDTTMVFQFRAYLDDGTMWNIWDPERVGPFRVARLPEGFNDWIFVLGADMGHSDPFALHVLAASPTDPSRTIYHLFEIEKPRMYAKLIAELLLGDALDHESPTGLYKYIAHPAAQVADMQHLGGAVLEELAQVYGVRFVAAVQSEKFASIELFNGDLIDGRFKALKGSHLADQLASLQWKPDEFGRLKENKGQANHATDAAIYGRRVLAVLFEREAPASSKAREHVAQEQEENESPPTSPRGRAEPRGARNSRRRNEFEDVLGDDGFGSFDMGDDFSF